MPAFARNLGLSITMDDPAPCSCAMFLRTPVSIHVCSETVALIDSLDDKTVLCGPDGNMANIQLVDEFRMTEQKSTSEKFQNMHGIFLKSMLEDLCIDSGVVSYQGKTVDVDVISNPDKTSAERAALADFHVGRTYSFPVLDTYIDKTLATQDPVAIIRNPRNGMIVPAIGKDGSDSGLVALVEKEKSPSGSYVIAGFFTGFTISVKNDMQGYGIGEALVLTRFLRDGGLPTWHCNHPFYSDSGKAVLLKTLDTCKEISKSLRTGTEMPSIVRKFELSINMDDPASTPGPGS